MRVPFYDIKAQYAELQTQMDEAVRAVISSGAYVMGHNHNALERELAERHGCRHGIAVNSGTDALRIIMDAAGIGPGDEVVTTAFTFVASAETVVQTGAKPVFVDIDPDTFQIDPDKIEAAITPRTKAILPVHLFGQLCDVDAIDDIAERRGLLVLEDAAQAIDSHKDQKFAGNFGLAAGLSFYVTKNLGAAGDGGLILTNDDEIADRCRSIRVHGMGRRRYYYDHLGYTSRLAEIQAAVLRVKLQKLSEWNDRRRKLAEIYFRDLADLPIRLPQTLPGNNHTYHQFTIRTSLRDELQSYLKDHNIDSMIYYPIPLHFHEPYAPLGEGPGSLPETEAACRECLSLPIHPHLTEEQVAWVAKCVRDFAESALAAGSRRRSVPAQAQDLSVD